MCLGVPGKIIAIVDAENLLAMVEVSGVQREVNIRCVVEPDQKVSSLVGAWVLVHVGFALSLLDETEAYDTLLLLQEFSEFQETQT